MKRIAALLMVLFASAPALAQQTYYRCAKCGQLHVLKAATSTPQRVVVQKPVQPASATQASAPRQVVLRPQITQPQQIQQRSYSPFAPSNQWPIQIDPQAQAFAEREVRIMAQRGQAGHFLGLAPGASMGGVGDSTGQGNVPTCIPKPQENKVLIADATYFDPRTNKSYRSRQWR